VSYGWICVRGSELQPQWGKRWQPLCVGRLWRLFLEDGDGSIGNRVCASGDGRHGWDEAAGLRMRAECVSSPLLWRDLHAAVGVYGLRSECWQVCSGHVLERAVWRRTSM